MILALSIATIGVLTVEPVIIEPAWITGLAVTAIAVLTGTGVLFRRVRLTLAGCILGLLTFTAVVSGVSTSLLAPSLLYGLALVLALDLAAFRSRCANANIDAGVLRKQVGFWFSRSVVVALAILVATLAGWAVSGLTPAWSIVGLVALGSLSAFALVSSTRS